MPQNQVHKIFEQLYRDPDFMPQLSSEDRKKEAIIEANSRMRQMDNTKEALSMVKAINLPDPGENHAFDIPKMPKFNAPKIQTIQMMEETNETDSPQGNASSLRLADLSMDELEGYRKNLSKLSKDWSDRGYRNVAHLYNTKMFDVDREINRRAKDEEKKILGVNFINKAWGGIPTGGISATGVGVSSGQMPTMRGGIPTGPMGMPPHPGLVWKPTTHRWVKPGTRDQILLPVGTEIELKDKRRAKIVAFDAKTSEYSIRIINAPEPGEDQIFPLPMNDVVSGDIKIIDSPSKGAE